MKKILISCVMLALGAFQLPAFAGGLDPMVDTWKKLDDCVKDDNEFISLTKTIEAKLLESTITNKLENFKTTIYFNDPTYSIKGPILGEAFKNVGIITFIGEGYGAGLDNSVIEGRDPSKATIENSGQLYLYGVDVKGGVSQTSVGLLQIGIGSNVGTYVSLSGDNNQITGGRIAFEAPYQGVGSTLDFQSGTIGSGAEVQISSGNTLQIAGGTVTLNGTNVNSGTNADTWVGNVSVSGKANLTLTNMTNGGAYTQSGHESNLDMTNSTLTLGSGSSITDGNVTMQGSTLAVNDGLTNNSAYINPLGTGSTLTVGNASSLTLMSGSYIGAGNTVNVGGGITSGSTLNVGSNVIIDAGSTVNIYGNDTLNVSGGNVTIDSTGLWAGNINLSKAGTLTLDGVTHVDTGNGTYSQVGGTLNLINSANAASGSSLTLYNTDSITTGLGDSNTAIVNIGINGLNYTSNNSLTLTGLSTLKAADLGSLTVNVGLYGGVGNQLNIAGGTLDSNVTLNLADGNSLNVSNGTATLNGAGTGVDTWNGDVNLSGGILNFDKIAHNPVGPYGGNYSQTGGTLNLNNGSSLTLSSSNAAIDDSNGQSTVNIGSNALDTGISLIVNGGSINSADKQTVINIGSATSIGNNLTLQSGTIGDGVYININEHNDFNISGGSVSIDAGVNWKGAVNLSGTGSLTLNSVDGTQHAPNGIYTQTGANTHLDMINDTVLTLGHGSAINSGHVGSSDGTSAIFVDGGTLAQAAVVTVATNGGGVKVLGGNATIDSGDTWGPNGQIMVLGGTLTLDGIVHEAISIFGGDSYVQTGGTMNLTNGSNLILDVPGAISTSGAGVTTTVNVGGGTNFSVLNLNGGSITTADAGGTTKINVGKGSDSNQLLISSSSSSITNGTSGQTELNIGVGSSKNNIVALINGSITGSGTTVNIGTIDAGSTGNSLTVAGGTLDKSVAVVINKNNTLDLEGATVTLNGTGTGADDWKGSVVNNAGSLTLNAISNKVGSTYTQTDNSGLSSILLTAGSTLTLESGSSISAGTIKLDGTTGNTGNTLNVSGGTLANAASVNLQEGNTLNVTGGTAKLNNGDIWNCNTTVSGGNFTVTNISNNQSLNGGYQQTGGTTLLSDGGQLYLTSGSSISGGTINLDGTTNQTYNSIALVGGSIGKAATVGITAGVDNTLFIRQGSVILNDSALIGANGDTWAGTVNLQQTGFLILDNFVHDVADGAYTQSGGTLNLINGSNLKISSGTLASGNATVNIGGGDTASTLTLNGGSITTSTGTTTVNIGQGSDGNTLNVTSGSSSIGVTGEAYTVINVGAGASKNNTLALSAGSIAQTLTTVNIGTTTTGSTGNNLTVSGTGSLAKSALVVINTGNALTVSGGTATINGAGVNLTDTWNGAINVSGTGNLTLNEITSNGIFNQTGGTTNLASDSTLTLLDNSNLGGGILANAGTVKLSNTGAEAVVTQFTGAGIINKNAAGTSTFTADNSGFTGTYNQTVGTSTFQNNFFGGDNKLTGGTTVLDTGSSLTLGAGDTWTNANISTTGGTLTLNAFNHDATTAGTYNQTAGLLNINNGSTLTLGTGSTISGGNIAYNVTGGTLDLSTGSALTSGAIVNLAYGNTLNVSGGSATLNTGDTLVGLINVTGGNITLDGVTSNGQYTQSGGQATIKGASTLTLTGDGTNNSSITAGSVGFTGVGNTLKVNANGTFGPSASVYISDGNNFTVNGGTATLNGGTAVGADAWSSGGTVNILGGALNLNTITSNGIFSLSAGTMNIASDSTLTYRSVSDIGGGNIVNNGKLNFSNDAAKTIFTNLTGTGVVNKNGTGTTTFMSNATGFNGIFNQTAGKSIITDMGGSFFENATKNLIGGSVDILDTTALTLNSTDTWTGTTVSNSGLFTLDGFKHSLTNAVGYTQTSTGNLLLTNGSKLNLGAGSSITEGNVAFGTGANALNVATGAIFNPNFTFAITANNNFNVSGGSAVLDSAHTTWDGTVGISAGTLELKDITVHGIYNQTGGTTTMDNGTILTLSDSSTFDGGILINNGRLNLTNTAFQLIQTTIGSNSSSDGTSQINKVSTGETRFSGDNSGYTGTFRQTAGIVDIQNNFFTGANHFDGGTANIIAGGNLILNSASSWTNTNITNSGGNLTLGTDHTASTVGTFNQTSGTTTINSGSTLSLALLNSNLSGGRLVNNGTLNLTTTAAGQTVATSLIGNNSAVINKNGVGTLLLTGQNLGYHGDLNVYAGNVDFNVASGLTDSYISGRTNLLGTSSLDLAYERGGFLNSPMNIGSTATLNLDTNGHFVISSSNNISGGGTLNVAGGGEYRVYAGSNGTFDYGLNVNSGSMTVITDATANFNNPVNVNSSTLRVSSGGANFNNGLTLDHGYLGILNGGFNVLNGLSVGSTVNTMNGVVATNNITGNLNIGASGTSEYLIDISPKAGNSDKYAISGDITTTNNNGVIKVSDFSVVGPHTLVQSVTTQVFDPAGIIDPLAKGITFEATDKTVTTALGQYGLTSNGGGSYTLGWKDFNPQVFRGQVATEAAYANQLTTNNVLFDHIGLVTQQMLAEDKPNVYANENPMFAPYQYSKKDGSLWYKGFGNIERLQLSQGINTQNNLWGSLVGADFPIVELKNGWKCLPTAYVGYTGGYQTYSDVNMYQNGGQAGVMGTFYKGNFITSLLANAGGYYNDMSVAGTRDQTGNWFAGLAAKSAYNIKLPKDFILQPNFLMSYNAFGQQNWNSDFGNASLSSGMLNGLNFGPGVNLILNKETWSVYATAQLMVNAMNGVSGNIDDVTLPTVKMGSTYISYGLGATKRIKDRLSLYGQVLFSNGVRTGVGFQGGLQWKL